MVNDVNIWAVNDGEKIYKTDLKNNNKNHNSVWDGNKIAVFSGKNEVVAFQIIIENQGNLIKKKTLLGLLVEAIGMITGEDLPVY